MICIYYVKHSILTILVGPFQSKIIKGQEKAEGSVSFQLLKDASQLTRKQSTTSDATDAKGKSHNHALTSVERGLYVGWRHFKVF